MNFSNLITKRYVFSKKQFQFISIISYLSLIGICIGVASLIIVTSIFNGFQSLTKKQFIGFDPHIQIKAIDNLQFLPDKIFLNKLLKSPKVLAIYPNISFRAVLISGETIQLVDILTKNQHNLLFDRTNNNLNPKVNGNLIPEKSGASIGIGLASNLNINPGDSIKILTLEQLDNLLTGASFSGFSINSLPIKGIFNSNIRNYDNSAILLNFEDAAKILNSKPNYINRIDIKLANINDIDEVKANIQLIMPNNLKLFTWVDLNSDLFGIMKFEKLSTFAILSLIILLAIFNILISLTMTVIEKQKDIGILRSLGANSTDIYKVFFKLGLFLGLIGTITGLLLGLSVYYGQIYFKWFKLDTAKYIIDSIPMEINYLEVIFTVIFSIALSAMVSLYPAYKASNTNVYNSIRSE